MSARGLARLLLAYACLVAALSALAHCAARGTPKPHTFLATAWVSGVYDARTVGDTPASALAAHGLTFARLTVGEVVEEGPIPPEPLAAFAFAPNVDGAVVRVSGNSVYLTPDDLRMNRLYDAAYGAPELGSGFGVNLGGLRALAAARLGVPVSEVAQGTLRRARIRDVDSAPAGRAMPVAPLPTAATFRACAFEAAHYLARNQEPSGRFRYLVRAETNQVLPGENWPRHAGATLFLGEAALASKDPALRAAAIRGADLLRTDALGDCGGRLCVVDGSSAGFGASALALLAFASLEPLGAAGLREVVGLADFLRSQQRADGEFAHEYDRVRKAPVDIQYMYYTGEAALALSRAHRLTQNPEDLASARRALSHLVSRAWHFFGDRYWVAEEHWTCQAMEDLWDRAPDPEALAFCLRWQEVQRAMQGPSRRPGDTVQDVEGSFGVTPFFSPPLTPTASRSEASVAILGVLVRSRPSERELHAAVRDSIGRALSLVARHQLRPGPSHTFRDSSAVIGAVPASPVDLDLRIDYAQHAGSAMLRYAAFLDAQPAPAKDLAPR